MDTADAGFKFDFSGLINEVLPVYFAADFNKVPVGGKETLGKVIVRIYKIIDEVKV